MITVARRVSRTQPCIYIADPTSARLRSTAARFCWLQRRESAAGSTNRQFCRHVRRASPVPPGAQPLDANTHQEQVVRQARRTRSVSAGALVPRTSAESFLHAQAPTTAVYVRSPCNGPRHLWCPGAKPLEGGDNRRCGGLTTFGRQSRPGQNRHI